MYVVDTCVAVFVSLKYDDSGFLLLLCGFYVFSKMLKFNEFMDFAE